MLLKVWSSDNPNTLLFDGKLNAFKDDNIIERTLNSTEDELTFQVEIPFELGNEFKGLSFKVDFVFEYVSSGFGDFETISKSIDIKDLPPLTTEGYILPSPSSNIDKYGIGGMAIFTGGLTVFIIHRKRRKDNKD